MIIPMPFIEELLDRLANEAEHDPPNFHPVVLTWMNSYRISDKDLHDTHDKMTRVEDPY